MNFLACDLGGTKVLLGIFERVINDDSPKLLFKKKYVSSDWDSFEPVSYTHLTLPTSSRV